MAPETNEKCKACGGFNFSMIDGFKYCDRCGTLLENFEELEAEEGGIQQTRGAGKIKIKKKGGDDGEKKTTNLVSTNESNVQIMRKALEKRSDFFSRQALKNDELAFPHESTPDYLYRLGLRLAAFTQVLAKVGHVLVKELNFEPRVLPTILATFQRYLAHCHVAFCHSEQCGSDEQLRFVAMMENLEFEQQEREEKRRKKLARRGKGVKALSKSAAAWTLLTQGNITENLDLDSEEDEEEEENPNLNKSMENLEFEDTQNDETVAVNDTTVGFVRKITTALSTEALRRARQMILNLEILVAIIHSALMSCGYRNVLASDVVRWIREDRFRISLRSIRLMRHSAKEQETKEAMTKVDYAEPYLRFPLYEITRTSTLFHQSLNLNEKLVSLNFETLAARLCDNLNLPVEFLSRVLLLESMIPCDVNPSLRKQADVSMGHNCEQLAAIQPKLYNSGFLSCFGRKERTWREADNCDEVLLSPDTKLMAYILLVFRLTFDIDNATCSPDSKDALKFDIDTWIHQLEMRLKCWQEHDMSMVLRSSCPVPDIQISTPFGPNYSYYDKKGNPWVHRLRRQVGFAKCIPSEMSFNSTSSLPTVFDIRQNRFKTERRQLEAVMSPLKFQRVILRKEMERDPEKYRNIVDPDSEKTFFKDFTTQKIAETSNSFDEYFPCASRYTIYKRPDWIQNCTARSKQLSPKIGPYRFYISNQACDDLLGVATSSFSPRFKFLLDSLALIIGEDPKALYTAFVMLEMHLTSSDTLETIRESLLRSKPITVKCQKFRKTMWHVECLRRVVTEHPVGKIEDLKYFIVASTRESQEELAESSEAYLMHFRNHEIREDLTSLEAEKVQNRVLKLAYDFETFFGILAVKMW
ncbi:hypothetical protein L5515_003000 [Caenorhabditis briggsae]|uniref:TATA box-binding protein-associated factor RNA polymerase I subunit B n=3 Tax=Caenorhabditis briggsae TaxID=6238 RepID=A0AAE9D8D4_CAEBR|nr:hypothetical protein L3Y34_000113 [Caenorhabditis briggsae]UMM21230.1 hypothetical protein L5515_003000 [Caenorhabditis briggsae]